MKRIVCIQLFMAFLAVAGTGAASTAIVVPRAGSAPTADELIAFARQHIAGYKVPKSVDFADELPRNPSGKVLKRMLRSAYWGDGERQVQ